MGRYAILSDIHGNMHALQEVFKDMERMGSDGMILLGDLIDCGMQSNEVVDLIRDRSDKNMVICNIWGNHERAIMFSDFTGFSSERGVLSAKRTAATLSEQTIDYLDMVPNKQGIEEFCLCGKKCLAVHGSLGSPYWKAIMPDDVRGDYSDHDIVFSGHSHLPHVFARYYDHEDALHRDKHAVLFINPGSVGQPRNHNPNAQYGVIDMDTMSVELRSVPYDIEGVMRSYDGSVDSFYRDRLRYGV